MRVKRGVTSHKRHKKLHELAKGYRGGRKNLIKEAKQAVVHAGADAYRGRKEKKRQMRSLWITQLNGALSAHNVSYSMFIHKLKENKIDLDRKVLSEIAQVDPEAFSQLVKKVS